VEELRTTEALDREILEDARKKAQKILKTAEDNLSKQKLQWDKKTSEALDSILKVYAGRTQKTNDEIFARLPLDKRRLRSKTAEEFLVKAMKDFLGSLKRETLLDILQSELSRRLNAFVEEKKADERLQLKIICSGLNLSEARMILEKTFASLNNKKFFCPTGCDMDFTEHNPKEFPYIDIEARSFRISASVESAAASLLREKRAELAAALLGKGVLDD
jgi:vacuolar-type H+-ATPase subunit H